MIYEKSLARKRSNPPVQNCCGSVGRQPSLLKGRFTSLQEGRCRRILTSGGQYEGACGQTVGIGMRANDACGEHHLARRI
jgi:hypothetical protein